MQNRLKEIGEILQECHRQAQITLEKGKKMETSLRKLKESVNRALNDWATPSINNDFRRRQS